MSRSYKHTPFAGDNKNKTVKRLANRRLRHLKIGEELPNKSYRKDTCSYDISDYEEVGTTFEQYYDHILRRWYNWGYKYNPFPEKEEIYQEWKKTYLRK